RAREIQAGPGIGAVADDVPQTVDLVHALLLDVAEHRLECGKVGVDVRDDGSLHGRSGGSAPRPCDPGSPSGGRAREVIGALWLSFAPPGRSRTLPSGFRQDV